MAKYDMNGVGRHMMEQEQRQVRAAAARISNLYPKAVYTHCAAHVLNLCVVKCCSISEIRNTKDIADSICYFIGNSPNGNYPWKRGNKHA